MNINQLRDREVLHLKNTLKRSVRLCKAIWEERDTISAIKEALDAEDLIYVGQLWNELDYSVQKLLITAPSKGGVFTTEERKIVTSVWEVSEQDLNPTTDR